MKTVAFLTLLLFVFAAGTFAQSSSNKSVNSIKKVLADQTAAWNRGDIDGFMQGYWNSPEMTFVSGDTVTKGWQPTLDRYKKSYNTRSKMGTLSFSELEITMLGDKAAVVLGRFTLEREKDKPTGLFTLSFRKFRNGWKIILDHTS